MHPSGIHSQEEDDISSAIVQNFWSEGTLLEEVGILSHKFFHFKLGDQKRVQLMLAVKQARVFQDMTQAFKILIPPALKEKCV